MPEAMKARWSFSYLPGIDPAVWEDNLAQNSRSSIRCMTGKSYGERGMSEVKKSKELKRDQHIQEMKEQLKRHFGPSEPLFLGKFGSPEEEEEFLEHILFIEGVGEEPLFDLLEKGGIQLPRPADMDDEQLRKKLWEVINGMALLGCYLSSTDHLSDRQLYEVLWTDILREPTSVRPNNDNAACHIDLLGGCSEEDLQLHLKYYADEEERLDWANQFPEDIIPPREPLAYDRDRHLPVPPSPHPHRTDPS